jgi:hypothetical protein
VPPEQCTKGTEGHNTASIGGFVTLPPVILGAMRDGLEAAQAAAVRHLALTHESQALAANAKVCRVAQAVWRKQPPLCIDVLSI